MICLVTLYLGIFAQFFIIIFLFGISATILNSVWMYREDRKFRERGLLRYLHGEYKEKQGAA
jgi:hypothetical protein